MPGILDISNWKDWESRQLRDDGINLYDPSIGDVKELTEKIKRANTIVTVDTALLHICAAMDRQCITLLPIYPDERWYKLRKPGNMYSKNCAFIQQSIYGQWESELRSVFNLVIS